MKPGVKHGIVVEALRATELMTAIAGLAAAALRNRGLLSIFCLFYCASAFALKWLSLAHPEAAQQRSATARLRKITIATAVISMVTLNVAAIIAPAFRPLAYIEDYFSFGPPPGGDWELAYKSNRYRGYLRVDSIKRENEAITFVFRVSVHRDARIGGIAYFVTQASANCVTRSSLYMDKFTEFTSAGKSVAMRASTVSLTNRQGGFSIILNDACDHSINRQYVEHAQ